MGGIAGFVGGAGGWSSGDNDGGSDPEDPLLAIARAMGEAMAHRGPDGGGAWADAAAGAALSHRSLARGGQAVTRGAAGGFAGDRQPAASACGRWRVVCNGGAGTDGRAGMDASPETRDNLASFIARHGVRATCSRLSGTFALAAWDRQERRLWLARDALGGKPLYWGRQDGLVLFASELKALRAHPGWVPRIQASVMRSYLRLGWIPSPLTIYQGIYKLVPGTVLSLAADGREHHEAFWSAGAVAARGVAARWEDLDDQLAAERLEELLSEALGRCRDGAETPPGVFLTGGAGSSLVAALLQRSASQPVSSFSFSFAAGLDRAGDGGSPADRSDDEVEALAARLGTDHTRLVIEPSHVLDILPRLPEIWDEPLADPAQVPAALLCALSRRHVGAVLSGEGADELFAGHPRHLAAQSFFSRISRLPHPLRQTAGALLSRLPPGAWPLAASGNGRRSLAGRLHRAGLVMGASGDDDLYRRLLSLWPHPPTSCVGDDWMPPVAGEPAGLSGSERMQLWDMAGCLPDRTLTRLDRAASAVGLELHFPLLDPRLVEWAWHLPERFRIRDGEGKWLLRHLLARCLPGQSSVVASFPPSSPRLEKGCLVPVAAWLRGPLRPWAEELLEPLRHEGRQPWFAPAPVLRAWRQVLAGQDAPGAGMWAVLMALAWHQAWGGECC